MPSSRTMRSAGRSLPVGHRVEVVERPVEAVEDVATRSARTRAVVVGPMREQEVAGGEERGGVGRKRGHGKLLETSSTG